LGGVPIGRSFRSRGEGFGEVTWGVKEPETVEAVALWFDFIWGGGRVKDPKWAKKGRKEKSRVRRDCFGPRVSKGQKKTLEIRGSWKKLIEGGIYKGTGGGRGADLEKEQR